MIKVKHARTADCVVAGFRWHTAGKDRLVGSLLLGLYDGKGTLHHVGVTSSFTMAMREQLAIDSGTPPSSCDGVPTSSPKTVVTISSRSPRHTSWRRCSARHVTFARAIDILTDCPC